MSSAHRPQKWHQWTLVAAAFVAVVVLLVLPLVVIFAEAFAQGADMVLSNLTSSDMIGAIQLTVIVALITVPVNLVFGVLLA
mgnify:FL=1